MNRRSVLSLICPGRLLTVRMFVTVLIIQMVVTLLIVLSTRYSDATRKGVELGIVIRGNGRHKHRPHHHPEVEVPERPKFKRPSIDLNAINKFRKLGFNVSSVHREPMIPVPSKMAELKEALSENVLPGLFQIFRTDSQQFTYDTPPPFVILTATDKNFIDLAENWRESIRRLGLSYDVLLMAEDEESHKYFFERTTERFRTVLSTQFALPGKLAKNISTYQQLIRRRTVYILSILQSGYDVLLVDIDAVWFKDPVKLVLDEYDKYDIWLAQGKQARFPCPCFFYMKSTSVVIKMVYDWIERLAYYGGKVETDQVALSFILAANKRNLGIKYFDYYEFPIGKQFFNWTWHDQFADRVYIAHGNHLGRSVGKVSKFKEFKVWLIDD
ncbi:UDP-D-xylose:L-fucose alpha-1,3-D-xylosyltransferase MGP4 [Strongylocentrotus purpuratus]|uniref:Nucleotide-diphospho-sugar transferase domain-containing protein n=1 Tax=Strongylocentrotus purpuratus TaxID=7668 RepID=A0A7M7GH22_STRPU|nr:UDP-D-xylose:L-fucose alpha-1,3-D-xylosyltransferase MGP4 [Strongylocentrotus purpuratus]